MRVTIHQPEFAPWLGFFHKVSLADALIFLDDAQFNRSYFHNRNRVRTADGWTWIKVPVKKTGLDTQINEAMIAGDNNPRWREKITRTVKQSYQEAPYFDRAFEQFEEIIGLSNETLLTLNVPLLEWMLRGFGLKQQVRLASSLSVRGFGSDRILELCKVVGADAYVSGVSGRDYLDLEAFDRAGIEVVFQEFRHPVYSQLHEEFMPQISALEALFLFGPRSRRLLSTDWPERLETVFE